MDAPSQRVTGQYGRRRAARRTSRLSGCGHLARRGEQIFQRPGQRGWICEDCALQQARDSIAARA